MLDPSNFVLAHNGTGKTTSPTRSNSLAQRPNGNGISKAEHIVIQDPRWKFVEESVFPKPREFRGGQRKYRAGRGSSVPLDLSALG